MRGSSGRVKEVLSGCLLVGICLLFSSSAALAEDIESIVPRHAFEIGLGAARYDYREDSVNVEIDGYLFEVFGSYTYHNEIMIHGSLEYTLGHFNYEGATFAGDPRRADAEDWGVECRGLFGYDYVLTGKHVLTPFFGMGYRYWYDDVEGTGGAEREIRYWYCPIGLKTYSPLSDNWTWGMSAEYDLFLDGTAKTRRSHYIVQPKFDQDSGYGMRFSLRFNRQYADRYALSIEPYIRYWDIDESHPGFFAVAGPAPEFSVYSGAIEPENDTTCYGLRISLEF